jgi:hypothetical protein
MVIVKLLRNSSEAHYEIYHQKSMDKSMSLRYNVENHISFNKLTEQVFAREVLENGSRVSKRRAKEQSMI